MQIEEEIKQARFRSPLHRLIVNLMYTTNWLCDSQSELLKPFALTVPQYNVLRILRGQHPEFLRLNDIIERQLDKLSNASRLVEKLVAKRLVTRTVHPDDRRGIEVLITQRGLALLQQIDEVQARWESQFKAYEGDQIDEFNLMLDAFRGVTTQD